MPKVIFVTTLTLWSMGKGHGGPAFTQTVKKYLDEGWEVYLISDEPSNRDFPDLDAAHNRFLPPTFLKRYGRLLKIGLLFRWLDHGIMTGRMYKAAREVMGNDVGNTVLYAYEVFGVKACRRLSRETGVPLVTRFQGTVLSNIPNTLINHIRRYPSYQALAARADCVIMTDDGTFGARMLAELGNNSPTLFLRNGLELMERDLPAMKAAFDRAAFRKSLSAGPDDTVFLTVSRLTGWKRVDRAIDGFASFLKTGRSGRLLIVGDGDTRPALEKQAEALGIADKVTFTGSVPHSGTYDYMMSCDVFLSLYDLSNAGNPLLEAMALGTCIVTLDTGDTASVVRNGENAVLLTAETLPALGGVLAELAQDRALREKLGANAALYAQSHFQTWAQRMDTEYQAVSALLKAAGRLCNTDNPDKNAPPPRT